MSDFADEPVSVPATPKPSDDFAPAPIKAPVAHSDFAPEPVTKPSLTTVSDAPPIGYERTENGLQPAGLIKPPEPDPSSLQEDARRVGEFVKDLPGRAVRGAVRAAEYVSDIPITHLMASRDRNAVKKYAAAEGGPNLADQNQPTGWDFFAAFEEGGRVKPEEAPDLNADVNVPGTDMSARQALNIGAHKTIGRGWKLFQREVGAPVAEGIERARVDARAAQDAESERRKGLYGYDPNPPIMSPEAEEMLSRELLSFLHGSDFRMKEEGPRTRRAVDDLQRQYGINGAAFAQSFARELGGLPLYLMSSGAGTEAAIGDRAVVSEIAALGPQAMKEALPKALAAGRSAALKEGLAEGATQGFVQASAQDGQDVFQGAGMGGLVGGIFGGVAALASTKSTLAELSHGAGFMLPPSTTKEFITQLDDVVNRAVARGPATVRKGANTAAAKESFARATEFGERNTPDFDLVHEPGDPVKPSASFFAIDESGQLVMRDVEVTAQYVQPKRSGKTSTVKVETKGKPGFRLVEGVQGESSGKLTIKVRKRDTPVTSAEAIERLATQQGRTVVPGASTPEASAEVYALLHEEGMRVPDDSAGGTPDYMPPEVAREYMDIQRQNEALRRLQDGREQQRIARINAPANPAKTILGRRPKAAMVELADTVPSPVVITAGTDGKLTTTVLRATPPKRPDTWVHEPGDTVLIDGDAPATVVGLEPDGALVQLQGPPTAPSKDRVVKVPQASLTHVPPEFIAPAHGGKPLFSVSPESTVDPRTLALVKGIEQGVTVPRLMQLSGRPDPAWAASALRELESQGVVKEVQPGLFVPARPASPKLTTGESPGFAVYIGTGGATGKGQIGILRGKDPRHEGNWLVERPVFSEGTVPSEEAGAVYSKTRMESVPELEVRTMKPVGYSDRQMAQQYVDLQGWNKPMPPQYYQASKATQGDIETLSKLYNKLEQQPSWMRQKWDGLKQTIAGAMHTAPVDLRLTKAQQLWGLSGMVRSEGLSRTKMLAQNLELGSEASREFTKVMEAQRARSPSGETALNHDELQKWAERFPREAASALDTFKRMVAESDEYSKFLAARGVTNIHDLETARQAGLLDEYLTRNYQAFMMPRAQWAEYAKKNMTQEWADAIRWLTEHRPESEFSNPAAELDELLRLDNPIKALEDRGYIKAEGTKKLLARSNVPEPFRRLLGEHRDAAVKLGFTTAYQRQLVKGIQAWDDVASHPNLWSPGWRPDMSLPVPNQPIYGKAAGGFLPDNVATRHLLGERALTTMEEVPAFWRATGWLGQRWKAAHTVYNQVSWANNAIRNIKGILLSGGFYGPSDYQGYRDAARMLMDYAKDPTAYGPNKLLIEAMDYDAVGPGLAGSELSHESKVFAAKMMRIANKARGGSTPLYDAMAEMGEKAMGVSETAHNGYDFVDKWAKLGSYINIRRRFIAQGMSVDEAAQRASLEVNKRFQNFQRTSNFAKQAAGNFSLAAPFMSSKLEDMRINATLVNDVLQSLGPQGDKELLFRLAAASALFGGAATWAVNARRANGITDEDEDTQRSNIPLRSKERHPFLIGSLSYDEHKRRTFYDLTPYEDLLNSFRGNINDPIAARFIFNNAQDIVGPQSFMGEAMEAGAAQLGVIHPSEPPHMPRPDQQGLLDAAAKYGPGFLPQGPQSVMRNVGATAPSGRLINPDALTPDQALMRSLAGQPKVLVGPQSHKQTLMETARNVGDATKDVKAAAVEAAIKGVSRERLQYMIKSNTRELKKSVNIPRPFKKSGD